jgi:serine/threonine-protein kinase HipA
MKEVTALLANRVVGVVQQDRNGRFKFLYDEGWRRLVRGAYPLSLSMPLAIAEHGHKAVEPFLWGLLPDNERALDRWARRFQVSTRNPVALLAHIGEDCAGAVQFVRPERLETLLAEDGTPEIEWLDEADIAGRLRRLRTDHSAWRDPDDTGQFSLAGAQPKTALLYENGRWGIPAGRTPTTHILKPPTGEFDGHAENEHVCLRLASKLGLIAVRTEVKRFADEIAIVVERYDRRRTESGIVRVHQEDMCQALSVLPQRKYENEGGPSARSIVELLQTASRGPEDVARFVDALIFNWLIGGTDAHAKNYSLLIGAGGIARLAPLYDVASILAYENYDVQKVKLAMKIGGEYRLRDIGVRQWRKLAGELHLAEDTVVHRVKELTGMLPDHLDDVRKEANAAGLDHPLIDRLVKVVSTRVQQCTQYF